MASDPAQLFSGTLVANTKDAVFSPCGQYAAVRTPRQEMDAEGTQEANQEEGVFIYNASCTEQIAFIEGLCQQARWVDNSSRLLILKGNATHAREAAVSYSIFCMKERRVVQSFATESMSEGWYPMSISPCGLFALVWSPERNHFYCVIDAANGCCILNLRSPPRKPEWHPQGRAIVCTRIAGRRQWLYCLALPSNESMFTYELPGGPAPETVGIGWSRHAGGTLLCLSNVAILILLRSSLACPEAYQPECVSGRRVVLRDSALHDREMILPASAVLEGNEVIVPLSTYLGSSEMSRADVRLGGLSRARFQLLDCAPDARYIACSTDCTPREPKMINGLVSSLCIFSVTI